jgi:hypothetical protein
MKMNNRRNEILFKPVAKILENAKYLFEIYQNKKKVLFDLEC